MPEERTSNLTKKGFYQIEPRTVLGRKNKFKAFGFGLQILLILKN